MYLSIAGYFRSSFMTKQKEDIQGKFLDKPLQFRGEDIKQEDLKVKRTPFSLEKDEFFVLTKSSSELKDWYKRLFQIGVGVLLTLVSKTIYILYQLGNAESAAEKGKIEFSLKPWEVISLLLAFGGSIILYGISRFVKSDKDELIHKMKEHFKK